MEIALDGLLPSQNCGILSHRRSTVRPFVEHTEVAFLIVLSEPRGLAANSRHVRDPSLSNCTMASDILGQLLVYPRSSKSCVILEGGAEQLRRMRFSCFLTHVLPTMLPRCYLLRWCKCRHVLPLHRCSVMNIYSTSHSMSSQRHEPRCWSSPPRVSLVSFSRMRLYVLIISAALEDSYPHVPAIHRAHRPDSST